MNQPLARITRAVLCVVIASLAVACGKDDVAPVDVEKQAFEDLRTQLGATIDDPAREAEAIRLVGELEKDLAVLRSSVAERKARVRALNAHYDTPRAEFESYLARVQTEVRDNRDRVSKTHQAFRATITAEEGSAIDKTHTSAMKAAIVSLQAI